MIKEEIGKITTGLIYRCFALDSSKVLEQIMSVDDILFSPIAPAPPSQEYLVDQVLAAFMTRTDVQFSVQSDIPFAVYERVAGLIESDAQLFRAARQLCCVDTGTMRPTSALTIRDVFSRIHQGVTNFHWAGKRSGGGGIHYYRFSNDFIISAGLPLVCMSTGNFEIYVLSLLSKFAGFNAHYAFGNHADAYAYWIGTP